MKTSFSKIRSGLTLIEMTLVVALVAILAVLLIPRVGGLAQQAQITAAEADLKTIRDAFVEPGQGYLRDLGGIPGFSPAYLRVGNLFVSTNVFGCKIVGPNAYGTETRGIRLDEGTDAMAASEGRARPAAFTQWDAARQRGWRGPYLAAARARNFPAPTEGRNPDDATFAARGFFPSLAHLRLPSEFKDETRASIYGFVGEPTLFDPWGNPYVIQVPPPQAFAGVTNIPDRVRFNYARVVSAGPDGILSTPCFGSNATNFWGATGWNERRRRLSRQAGLIDGQDRSARGDDLVLFFSRNDVDEGEESN